MDSSNIVAILLFILPGILSEKISHKMDFPIKENMTELKEIVNGVLLSLPIILIAGIITSMVNSFSTLEEFIAEFDDLMFLATFGAFVFVLAIILGVFKGLKTDWGYKIVNMLRGRYRKMEIDDKSCWRQVFLEENVSRYVKIFKDGELLSEGFARHYSLPDEDMEIVLENQSVIEEYPEIKSSLKLCMTYVNIEKGVIVEVYDTEAATRYVESLQQENE